VKKKFEHAKAKLTAFSADIWLGGFNQLGAAIYFVNSCYIWDEHESKFV
tara:strand:- start:99 stop:245 length:147 start_codon:yes stop_codon:yes gene_type:complete